MIMSDYNYERYETILTAMLDSMWRDPDELEIGENISDLSEVKIIFDGFADLETEDENGGYEYLEGGNTNLESYAIFIHKDALKEGFEFPEHEMTFWALVHRPAKEVCIYAWYDVEKDEWEIIPLEERIDDDCVMNEQDVMVILEGLYNRYYNESE